MRALLLSVFSGIKQSFTDNGQKLVRFLPVFCTQQNYKKRVAQRLNKSRSRTNMDDNVVGELFTGYCSSRWKRKSG